MANNQTVHIIGHMNPDTDSICSALTLEYLKNQTSEGSNYKARRAGNVNPETQFVLDHFGMEAPELLDDVRPRVRNTELKKLDGIPANYSMKKAWEYMHQEKAASLAIVEDDGHMIGLISMGDITRSYMEVYDSSIIGKAHTPYRNLIETLNGEMIEGDINGCVCGGKTLIAAANPDIMEQYIDEGDLIILGNRYEAQLCAIEMGASCIIISNDAPVSITIRKIAADHGCTVIQSGYDTLTIARLINQSIPVGFFLNSSNIISFALDDFLDDVAEVMAEKRFRYFPVVDDHGKYVAMISRRNLLSAIKRQLILVDHNEKSQAVPGIDTAEIVEIIDHHRIGNIETMGPVYFRNQPVGCTATILYQMYMEKQLEIPVTYAGLMMSAILSDTLAFRSPTCTPLDKATALELAKIAGVEDVEAYATEMFAAGSNLRDASAEEIFTMDFKKFKNGNLEFGVGQISSMSAVELDGAKAKLLPRIEAFCAEQGTDMIFMMLTNIMKEESEVLYTGEMAAVKIREAFELPEDPEADATGSVLLSDVVSRKKQMIPKLMAALRS